MKKTIRGFRMSSRFLPVRTFILAVCWTVVIGGVLGTARPARSVEVVEVSLELREGGDNYDDPCFWQDPTDPVAALACITSKDDDHVECFALPSGTFVGLATGFSGAANNCDVDQARDELVTTDHGGDRVLVHRLPDLGAPIRALADAAFRDVTGVCVAHADDRSLVFVTDESAGRVFALDSVTGATITSFPHGLSKAEGIACDDSLGRVYVCDDESDSRSCRAFTFTGTPVGPEFGIPETTSDSEGVALYECGPTEGYIIVSDQAEDEFEVFEREPPFAHRCTFELRRGSDVTDETDGIDVAQIPAYPGGIFGACDGCGGSQDELDLVPWESIATACGLRVCPLGQLPGGPVCGDGARNQPAEACDGTDDAACPGRCDGTCRCLPGSPGSECGVDLAACDDEDPCTADDRCLADRCGGRVTSTDGIVCRFRDGLAQVCGAEELPVRLASLITRKDKRLRRVLEKATLRSTQGRTEGVERLRMRATRQLAVIARRAERAARARRAPRQISTTCHQQIDAALADVRDLITSFPF